MLKDNLILFFKKNSDIFERNYAIASKSADTNAVHDLRVSIKRMSTCIRMLNFEKRANYRLKKCFKQFIQLFKKAGTVRDFQVQAIILEEIKQTMEINESILNLFDDKKEVLENEFVEICKTFKLHRAKRTFRLIEHYICQLSENEIARQIENYEKNRKSILNQFSNPRNKLFNLHNARKIIKDLCYLIEMSGLTNTKQDADHVTFKRTGHLLGDWHDRAVMLNFLNQTKIPNFKNAADSVDLLTFSVSGQKEMFKERYLEEYRAWLNE